MWFACGCDMPKQRTLKSITPRKSLPYARGFRPPSATRCIKAISHPSLPLDELPAHLVPHQTSLSPLPKPTSIDDWLAQYKEPGQDFARFLSDNPWLSSRKWRQMTCDFNSKGKTITERYPGAAIYLVPLGSFDTAAPAFSDLAEYVRLFYGLPVKSIDGVDLEFEKTSAVYLTREASPFSSSRRKQKLLLQLRYNRTTGHRQLQVGSILTALRQLIPADALFVVALTMEDLYDENPDLFVAGMAAGNHRVGMFSFHRYDPAITFSPEHWYDVKRKKTAAVKRREHKRLVLQRSCKLLVHELAHLLGVDHCIWYDCCMNGSGHLQEDFRQSMFLCPVDLNKLQRLCGFDVVARYRGMMGYFGRHELEEERGWVERRLGEITASGEEGKNVA